MGTTKIIVADDHPVVRQGLRRLLEAEPDFVIVGEVTNGLEVADLVERLQPEVLILDLVMPGLSGLAVLPKLQRASPDTHVLVFSMYAYESYVIEALRLGATGYVLKDSGAEEIIRAVREVSAGKRYLGAPLTDRAIDAYISKSKQDLSLIHI